MHAGHTTWPLHTGNETEGIWEAGLATPPPILTKHMLPKYAIKWGVVSFGVKIPWNKGNFTEKMVHEPTLMADKLQLLRHTNPDFYAIYEPFLLGMGVVFNLLMGDWLLYTSSAGRRWRWMAKGAHLPALEVFKNQSPTSWVASRVKLRIACPAKPPNFQMTWDSWKKGVGAGQRCLSQRTSMLC